MKDDPGPNRQSEEGSNSGGGFAMMAMMMACCLGSLLIFALIPLVGLPLGLAIGAVGFVAMLFAHQKFMGGHSSHH